MWKWARGLFGAALVVYAIYGIHKVVVPVICPPPKPVVTPKPAPIGNPYEMRVIELTNAERVKRGLRPLEPRREIMSFARGWSATQSRSRMHHSRGSGYAENVAVGQSTPEAVMQAWMGSRGHRANILNPNYRYIGVGYVNNGRPYWTQNFR